MTKTVADTETIRAQAFATLMAELEKGEQSAREKGWLTADEVEAHLGITI